MRFNNLAKGLTLAAMLAASTAFPTYAATPASTFVIAQNIGDVITFDPAEAFEFTNSRIIANAYESIMTFESDDLTSLVGGAIQSFVVSDDGKKITLKMRDGLKFHSGNPLTAKDAAYSLQRVVKLGKTPSFIITQIGWTPENVDTAVVAIDDNTLEVNILADLSSALVLNLLSSTVASVVDMKLVQENEVDGDMGYGWLKNHTAGSGPYMLKTWKANELILLASNPDDRHGAPAMKSIAFRHVPEPSAQRLLLEKGDVDAAIDLSSDQIKGLKGNDDIKINVFPQGIVAYLANNMTHPVLSKPKVLQAMRYMVDYEGMVGSFLEGQYKIHQNFWPSGMWASNTDISYTYDIEKAKALIAEANIPADTKIVIDTENASPWKEIAQSVQQSLSDIGIESDIILSDGATLWPKFRSRKHDLIVARWGPDYADPHSNADAFASNPDNRFEAKLTGKLTWRTAWDAKDVTPLTAQAAAESDPEKRFEIYQKLQKMVREDSAFTIMFQSIGQIGQRANVDGFINGATSSLTFYGTVVKN